MAKRATNTPSPPSNHHIEVPQTSRELYLKDLLTFIDQGGRDVVSISSLVEERGPNSHPCLLRDGHIIYSFQPYITALTTVERGYSIYNGEESPFFRLDYDTSSEKQIGDLGIQEHDFLALGWLSEVNIKTKEKLVSNYAVCLDVTDKPMSLWLVFDYPRSNNDRDDLYQENFFRDIYNTADYISDSQVADQPSFIKPLRGGDRISKTPAFPRGLFQAFRRFDVVKLSNDVCADWIGHADDGLDPYQMNCCMQRTVRTYGGTLRAVESWPRP